MTSLSTLCSSLEESLPLTNSQIFSGYSIPEDYPWREKMTDESNMYACLYGLAQAFSPWSILEIGTGWGLSLMTWLELGAYACSLDRGGFMEEYGVDNLHEVRKIVGHHVKRADTQLLYSVETRPAPQWFVSAWRYDVLFVDGDHGSKERPWALFSDLWQFWPFLSPGGLCICDDVHDPQDYEPGWFPWLGYTWASFERFTSMLSEQIADQYIWNFPFVPSGKRPVGLIVKAK